MRRLFTAVAVALLAGAPAAAQTADEIIAKNVAAKGSLEKLKAVQTVRMTGKMTVGLVSKHRPRDRDQRPHR